VSNKVSYVFIAQDKFSRVTREASRAVKGLKERVRGVRAELGKTDVKMQKLMARTKKFGQGMKEMGMKAFAGIVLPLGFLGNKMINAARDAEEARSKFGTVFKDISGASEAAADSLATSFGLAGTKARELLGDTGDLLTGFGFAQKEALDVSTRINELAVDLASFTNYAGGAEGASAALTKALLGERESLKSLGIAISEENVKQEIAVLMAQGRTFQTLRQAKAHATLSLAVKQSKNAVGDFARTSASLANQERLLAADTQNMAEEFGKLLMPIKLVIVQGLSTMFKWLNSLSPEAKKFTLILVGVVFAAGALLTVLGALAFILPAIAAGVALIASPFLLIPLAIAAVVAALVWAYKNFESFRALVDGVGAAIAGAFDVYVSMINGAVDTITDAWATVSNFFGLGGSVDVNSASRTDVNVNLVAPAGTVESVKTKTAGRGNANVGVNMAAAGA
jgi:hypothetical protein